jgi:alkylhydroperoxidase family enzyme
MARVSYPELDDLKPADRALMEQLPPLNVFRMLSGTGASFAPFMSFISAYLNDGILNPELRELIILRVGHLCGSTYEVHQHERVARTLNMSEDRIAAIKQEIPSAAFSDAENAALLFADEQVAKVKVSDASFAATQEHLTDQEIVELTLVVGTYIMVCRFLETLEVDLEEEDITGSGLEEIERSVQALGATT